MRFRNTSIYFDHFLKAIMRWCCKELEFSMSEIKAANFGHRDIGWRGRANYKNMSIWIRTSRIQQFPTRSHHNERSKTAKPFFYYDEMEVLVNIVGHEIAHLRHHVRSQRLPAIRKLRRKGGTEGDIQAIGNWLIVQFRNDRERLLMEWNGDRLRCAADAGD